MAIERPHQGEITAITAPLRTIGAQGKPGLWREIADHRTDRRTGDRDPGLGANTSLHAA